MTHKLVTFKKDYADEFYVYGFKIFSPQEFEEWLKEYKQHGKHLFVFSFGTNEEWYEEDKSWNDVLRNDMTITDLTPEQYDMINKLFATKNGEWGTFPVISEWAIDDEDEEEEEEEEEHEDDDAAEVLCASILAIVNIIEERHLEAKTITEINTKLAEIMSLL